MNQLKEPDQVLIMIDACICVLRARNKHWESVQNKIKKVEEFNVLSHLLQHSMISISLLESAKFLIDENGHNAIFQVKDNVKSPKSSIASQETTK